MQVDIDRLLTTAHEALDATAIQRAPFPHFIVPQLFDVETAQQVLRWLETEAPWSIESKSFYVQHGCDVLPSVGAGGLPSAIGTPDMFSLLREHLQRLFGTALSPSKFSLGAHRLLPGHRIGTHNDAPVLRANSPRNESHRLVIHLNPGFDDEHGGHLVLFDRSDPVESAVIVRPLHNSAVAMEFSPHSWHYIDEVRTGARYTLLYGFWTETSPAAPGVDDERPITTDDMDGSAALLRQLGADTIGHSGRSLLDHLLGTHALLTSWGCDSDACRAGLFHSIFGTPSVSMTLVSEVDVAIVRDTMGERAFSLVQLYRHLTASSLTQIAQGGRVMDRGRQAAVGPRDQRALTALFWANLLEQAPYVKVSPTEAEALGGVYRATEGMLPAKAKESVRALIGLA